MSEIKNNHIFCCNKDLGKVEKDKVYFCRLCNNLFMVQYNPQRTLDNFKKSEEE